MALGSLMISIAAFLIGMFVLDAVGLYAFAGLAECTSFVTLLASIYSFVAARWINLDTVSKILYYAAATVGSVILLVIFICAILGF